MPKKIHKPKPMNTDHKSQSPLREAVEAQLAEVQAAQTSAQTTAMVPVVQQVDVRNSKNSETTRSLMKDTRTGKFVSKSKARAMLAIETTQRSLEAKCPDTQKTQQQLMEERLIYLVKNASEEGIVGAAKAYETLQSRAHGRIRNSALDEEKSQAPITVLINAPNLKAMTEEEFQARFSPPARPTFVDAEIVSENPQRNLDKA